MSTVNAHHSPQLKTLSEAADVSKREEAVEEEAEGEEAEVCTVFLFFFLSGVHSFEFQFYSLAMCIFSPFIIGPWSYIC